MHNTSVSRALLLSNSMLLWCVLVLYSHAFRRCKRLGEHRCSAQQEVAPEQANLCQICLCVLQVPGLSPSGSEPLRLEFRDLDKIQRHMAKTAQ